jgi:excisionase family DNA binding protein
LINIFEEKEVLMAYRLEADETISTGVRRLLFERVQKIIDDLTNPEIDRDKGVHNARKSCKRIRAAYRLIRDEIGHELYRQENIRFRDTARLLAGARDSWVMLRTLDNLWETDVDQLPPRLFSSFRQRLTEQYEITLTQELENQRTIPAIIESMDEACFQIGKLPIENEDFSAFRLGIRRVYRRGRKAKHLAYTYPSSEVFHEWRKRVKYLWYQLEILEALWPNILSRLADELHLLSDYLGDDHDLAVLRVKALEEWAVFKNETELLNLIQMIDQKRLALEALARPLGERLYFDPPKRFTRRLETFWQAWQIEAAERQGDLIEEIQNRSPVYVRMDQDLFSTTEMAAGLEISTGKVRQLIYDDKLPAEKVGKTWVIRSDDSSRLGVQPETDGAYIGVILSTRDVATRLNESPENVRKLIQSGELPAIKLGQQWIILEKDLEAIKK